MENNYGCMYCAPSRASLLTGYSDIRKNKFILNRAGIYIDYLQGRISMDRVQATIDSIEANEKPGMVLPQVFKKAGYVTGEIGKLEWGFAVSFKQMKEHGWDYYYGYLDHRMCHGFYPMVMFENGKEVKIAGNSRPDAFVDSAAFRHGPVHPQFAEDLFMEKARDFIIRNRSHPFFLYFPTNLPHGPVSAPAIAPEFAARHDLTYSQKMYATMVKIIDDNVGKIKHLVDSLGISRNTIIMFGSDNGHYLYYEGRKEKVGNINTKFLSENGGDIFNGNDGLAGLKETNWEGGVRVPLVYYWPGTIKPGISDHLLANYDILATMADLLHVKIADNKDGLSYLPELYGKQFNGHQYVVFSSMIGPALVTKDGWKLRTNVKGTNDVFQLYYLPRDYREDHDLATKYPEKLNELKRLLLKECGGSYTNGIYNFEHSPATELDQMPEAKKTNTSPISKNKK